MVSRCPDTCVHQSSGFHDWAVPMVSAGAAARAVEADLADRRAGCPAPDHGCREPAAPVAEVDRAGRQALL